MCGHPRPADRLDARHGSSIVLSSHSPAMPSVLAKHLDELRPTIETLVSRLFRDIRQCEHGMRVTQ